VHNQSIKIKNIRTADSDRVLALLDVEFVEFGMTVNGCKLLEGRHGRWLALPSFPEKIDGETKWFAAVSLPKELAKVAQDAALTAFCEMKREKENALDEIPF